MYIQYTVCPQIELQRGYFFNFFISQKNFLLLIKCSACLQIYLVFALTCTVNFLHIFLYKIFI